MRSPTQRSLEHLRNRGLFVAVVEKWIDFQDSDGIPLRVSKPGVLPGVRRDTFGADILAIGPKGEKYLVQTTDSTSRAKREAKLCSLGSTKAWLHRPTVTCPACTHRFQAEAPGQLETHGWQRTLQGRQVRYRLIANELYLHGKQLRMREAKI